MKRLGELHIMRRVRQTLPEVSQIGYQFFQLVHQAVCPLHGRLRHGQIDLPLIYPIRHSLETQHSAQTNLRDAAFPFLSRFPPFPTETSVCPL
jgi:hypothetical protein